MLTPSLPTLPTETTVQKPMKQSIIRNQEYLTFVSHSNSDEIE
jgi:hypothetical protein